MSTERCDLHDLLEHEDFMEAAALEAVRTLRGDPHLQDEELMMTLHPQISEERWSAERAGRVAQIALVNWLGAQASV